MANFIANGDRHLISELNEITKRYSRPGYLDSEDVAMEALERCLRQSNLVISTSDGGNPKAYTHRATTTTAIDYYRRGAVERKLGITSLELEGEKVGGAGNLYDRSISTTENPVEQSVVGTDQRRILLKALEEALKRQGSEAAKIGLELLLKQAQGHSYEELQREYHLTHRKLKNFLFKMRERLRNDSEFVKVARDLS